MIALAVSPVDAKQVTWSIAYNGDIQFSSADQTVLDVKTGPNFTYASRGNTCPAAAADSAHIYIADSETAASVVGHPIQLGSGNICIALSQTTNAGHTLVTVGCPIGSSGTYNTNFGSTPGNGAAYTIYPCQTVLSVGAPASGAHTIWAMTCSNNDSFGMVFFSATTSPAYSYLVQSALGAGGWGTYSSATLLASPSDGVGQIFVANNGNHEGVFYFPNQAINITVRNLGLLVSGRQRRRCGKWVLVRPGGRGVLPIRQV